VAADTAQKTATIKNHAHVIGFVCIRQCDFIREMAQPDPESKKARPIICQSHAKRIET